MIEDIKSNAQSRKWGGLGSYGLLKIMVNYEIR